LKVMSHTISFKNIEAIWEALKLFLQGIK
jgi:hypothetical protein